MDDLGVPLSHETSISTSSPSKTRWNSGIFGTEQAHVLPIFGEKKKIQEEFTLCPRKCVPSVSFGSSSSCSTAGPGELPDLGMVYIYQRFLILLGIIYIIHEYQQIRPNISAVQYAFGRVPGELGRKTLHQSCRPRWILRSKIAAGPSLWSLLFLLVTCLQ